MISGSSLTATAIATAIAGRVVPVFVDLVDRVGIRDGSEVVNPAHGHRYERLLAKLLAEIEGEFGEPISRERLELAFMLLPPSAEYLAAERRRAERAEKAELNRIRREEGAEQREAAEEAAETEEERLASDAARRAAEEQDAAQKWADHVKRINRKDRP